MFRVMFHFFICRRIEPRAPDSPVGVVGGGSAGADAAAGAEGDGAVGEYVLQHGGDGRQRLSAAVEQDEWLAAVQVP